MSVFFTSDPHLGHRSIAKYRPFVRDTQHNSQLFVQDWLKHIGKNDVVYMLGDVAFDDESLKLVGTLPGRKILIKGNHDNFVSTKAQAEVFEEMLQRSWSFARGLLGQLGQRLVAAGTPQP